MAANLRILCVLIVLAAVCWEANSKNTEKSTRVCGREKLRLKCDKRQIVMIRSVQHGNKRYGKRHVVDNGRCAPNMKKTIQRKCNRRRGCTLIPYSMFRRCSLKACGRRRGRRCADSSCYTVKSYCVTRAVTRGGRLSCLNDSKLYVAPFVFYKRKVTRLGSLRKSNRSYFNKIINFRKACHKKQRCYVKSYIERPAPGAVVLCMPNDVL